MESAAEPLLVWRQKAAEQWTKTFVFVLSILVLGARVNLEPRTIPKIRKSELSAYSSIYLSIYLSLSLCLSIYLHNLSLSVYIFIYTHIYI